jgi:signal transduction histidine kinase
MQQNYARVSGEVELLPMAEVVEDAIQFNAAAFARHGIQLVREFDPVPPIAVDKHKVLQILVNLLHNAKYAMESNGPREKRLTLGLHRNGGGSVQITVRDSGIGIPTENLTRIFSHGFTTRKGGHGFGLHSGALAAKEMGGNLTAHSEGPERGAVFTLELPENGEAE